MTDGRIERIKDKAFDIRDRAQTYLAMCYDRKDGFTDPDSRYELYISHLLGDELVAADKSRPETPSHLQRLKVHTLAMTVGMAFEPLLQAICVHNPKQLLLVMNRRYGEKSGEEHGEMLKRIICDFLLANTSLPGRFVPSQLSRDGIHVDVLEKADSPTAVFRLLNKAFREPWADLSGEDTAQGYANVVDITGAKKNMIVGAFLYAAHSHLPITYVDFDKYDSTYDRPYGYTARIGRIDDPYETFRLRDWERVRQEYRNYNFRAAKTLLVGTEEDGRDGILAAMKGDIDTDAKHSTHPSSSRRVVRKSRNALFDDEDVAAVERLVKALKGLEAWNNGQYTGAHAILAELDSPKIVPIALPTLAASWPDGVSSDEGFGQESSDEAAATEVANLAKSLYRAHIALKEGKSGEDGAEVESADPTMSLFYSADKVLAYAGDEIAKIHRLIKPNEDYRSAFLRAIGLDEFLLKARLAIRWIYQEGIELEYQIGEGDWRNLSDSAYQWKKHYRHLLKLSNFNDILKTLKGTDSIYVKKGSDKPHKNVRIRAVASAKMIDPYWEQHPWGYLECVDNNGNSILRQLRNEAIHTHLYIPQSVAEAATKLAESSINEFVQNGWLDLFEAKDDFAMQVAEAWALNPDLFSAPTWFKLCAACGIDFLPPQLQHDD